jgi:hypothetical protein
VLGDRYEAHIGSLSVDYKSDRAWWGHGRLAAKSSADYTVSSPDQGFNAWLISTRWICDLTEHFDIGMMASLQQQAGAANGQAANGVEAGYRVHRNVWISLGYNWSGFYDRDLSGVDYTRQGAYIRLRAKFDEKAFSD